jgi:hypothetical protein
MEREALKLALEALEEYAEQEGKTRAADEAITAIQAVLAQPAQEQRPWVGLTDDELADLWYKESLDWMEFARAHEAALKEKNSG